MNKFLIKNTHCVKKKSVFGVILVRILLTFSHIWTEYGEIQSISPYSVRIHENTVQNNSEYGHFSCSENLVSKLSTLKTSIRYVPKTSLTRHGDQQMFDGIAPVITSLKPDKIVLCN